MKKRSSGGITSYLTLPNLLLLGGASFTIPFLYSLLKHIIQNRREKKRIKKEVNEALKEMAEDELMHGDIRDFLMVPEERVKKGSSNVPGDIATGTAKDLLEKIVGLAILPSLVTLLTTRLIYSGYKSGRRRASELIGVEDLDDPAEDVLRAMKARYVATKLKHMLESMGEGDKEKYGRKFEIKLARDEAAAVAALIAGPCSREAARGELTKKASEYTINDIAAACLMKISDPDWKKSGGITKHADVIGRQVGSFLDSLLRGGGDAYFGLVIGLPLALGSLLGSVAYLSSRSMTDPEGEVMDRPARKKLYKLLAEMEQRAGIPLATPHFTLPKSREIEELAEYLKTNPSGRLIIRMRRKRKKEKDKR